MAIAYDGGVVVAADSRTSMVISFTFSLSSQHFLYFSCFFKQVIGKFHS